MKKQTSYKLFTILITYSLMSLLLFFIIPTSAIASEINIENIVRLVNKSRSQHNLNLVYINAKLNKIATDKSQDMAKNHYFAHTSPQGLSPWHWFKKNNYNYIYAGENLAINYKTAEEQHLAWMNSPTHRKNILNPNYQEIGVGFSNGIIDHKKSTVIVQVFGTPQSSPIATQSNVKQKTILAQSEILGEKSTYLKQITSSTTDNYNILQKNNSAKPKIITPATIKIVQKQTKNIVWLTILVLTMIILRDAILKTIAIPYNGHAHRTTNLILLLILWSVLIGI